MPCRTPIASRRVRLRVARLVVLVGAAFLLGERNGHLRRCRQLPACPEFSRQSRPHGRQRGSGTIITVAGLLEPQRTD